MKNTIFAVVMVCLLLMTISTIAGENQVDKKIRVGVYDNRAIAFAYFDSEFNPLEKKMDEYEQAKKASDSALIKELEAWGPKFQRQIHFQGFCRAPVDDLLLLVKDKLAGVAKQTGVDLIGWYPDFTGTEVETIDITDELVALFNPSKEKLKQIKEIKNTEPADLTDIEH